MKDGTSFERQGDHLLNITSLETEYKTLVARVWLSKPEKLSPFNSVSANVWFWQA